MNLGNFYREIIKKGIEEDVRSRKEIDACLEQEKKNYEALDKKVKDFFDIDRLFNPYADTRILNGDPKTDIKSVIVGVDVEAGELAAVEALRRQGKKIDLAIAHHPEGHAFANFYDVMDLQVDIYAQAGVSVSVSQNLLAERKQEVARRVSAANHRRGSDIARLLGINFLCMHTPCDNCAYQFMKKTLNKRKPSTLAEVMDIILDVPEYTHAAKNNNAPVITIGSKRSRCKNIHFEFTGGTEGPKEIYEKLAAEGIDTIIAMHQSEEHYKQSKKANINVIVASHIASDNIGINLMLDHLEKSRKLEVFEFSGFKRVKRKAK
jgi:putative NIF3 family GTP cyclohydrolase 1 type 2